MNPHHIVHNHNTVHRSSDDRASSSCIVRDGERGRSCDIAQYNDTLGYLDASTVRDQVAASSPRLCAVCGDSVLRAGAGHTSTPASGRRVALWAVSWRRSRRTPCSGGTSSERRAPLRSVLRVRVRKWLLCSGLKPLAHRSRGLRPLALERSA